MDLRVLIRALARAWWALVIAAAVSGVAAWLILPDARYETTIRATVLIAGNTERPGQSERPELMVLDDLLPLVESPAFAERVRAEMEPANSAALDVEDIQRTITSSRYSRVLAVTVSGASRDRVAAIASAVNAALPGAVSTYLVAPGDRLPVIQIIDPGSDPRLQTLGRWLRIGVIVMFATFGMTSLVWLRESFRESAAVTAQPVTGESTPAKNEAR